MVEIILLKVQIINNNCHDFFCLAACFIAIFDGQQPPTTIIIYHSPARDLLCVDERPTRVCVQYITRTNARTSSSLIFASRVLASQSNQIHSAGFLSYSCLVAPPPIITSYLHRSKTARILLLLLLLLLLLILILL
jgi:hypothetical protein